LKMTTCIFKGILNCLCAFLVVLFCMGPSQAKEEEKETYSISLVKTAGIEKDIREVDDKKVLTQEYVVEEGDWVWKILRERGLLKGRNLSELLSVLKKMNRSLHNLDLLQPGEKIIIPLKIVPLAGPSVLAGSQPEIKTPVADLKDLDLENYMVKPGDSLIRVVKGRYKIPQKNLYSEYLKVVKRLNPSIQDLNTIHPGQKIRLPIYSPEIVRKPIEPAGPPRPEKRGKQTRINPMAGELCEIFLEMGEEWAQAGQHFIPLKSGGLIDLKAKSFPIINLQTGLKVIVDLSNSLPERMARLIESSRGNYRVVHLLEKDDLRSSLDKIITVCSYPKVFRMGEALELGGDIHHRITGDWIITPHKTGSNQRPGFIVINLIDTHTPAIPGMIKDYVKELGVRVIDYPPGDDDTLDLMDRVDPLEEGSDPSSLVRTVLNLTSHSFSTQVEIPVYQGQEADFKLIIKADFLLKIKGRDAVIDLTGLAPEIISLLKEQQFFILALAAEKEPLAVVARTLKFLDVQFEPGPHSFMAATRDDSRNIRLTLPGIVFADPHGKAVLVTPLSLPDEIAALLTQRGYKILALSS